MKLTATDNSVRDHPQQAIISNGQITIRMKVGREVRGAYSFPLADWLGTETGPSANPNWNQINLIRKYTGNLDDQPGGPCQADQIRDAQIYAIRKALAKIA